jgi:FAD/FMN-containing dehydrogenase
MLMPNWILNHPLMRAYNRLHALRHGRRTRTGLMHPQEFFYPLDSILNWNRIYGARGFTQYQCVLPYASGVDVWRRLVRIIADHDAMTYLCVVKDFGEEGVGTISFPRPGITVTFDLPVRMPETQRLVDALNDVVVAEGGRVYLAKDALTRREQFVAMDPRIEAFDRVRRAWDPDERLRSALSVRLFGDRA